MAGKKTVIESEQNLTDIGAVITINPPENVTSMPTSPTMPTGIPTSPTTTTSTSSYSTTPTTSLPSSTTPTTTTETVIFNDTFEGTMNPAWLWVDPDSDATYDLTARPGYLRITVPDGNDLAGVVNYGAPRLLVPQYADFIMETAFEYNPAETYQGAGLVVWQDEDTFSRFEFGYGGMGGLAKNVSFLKQESGGLSVVNTADLPEATAKVEMRLQRKGNQFTAWYRLSNGSWQEIGTTELELYPVVQIGITQIAVYGPSTIPADFDYFKLSLK
jgi:beta-xylosidase